MNDEIFYARGGICALQKIKTFSPSRDENQLYNDNLRQQVKQV